MYIKITKTSAMTEKTFLTRAEHQVMLALWNLGTNGGFTNDILQNYSKPKPAYTTLATFLKILTRKDFVNAEKIGSMLFYTPKVSKEEYFKNLMEKNCDDFFNNDYAEMIRFVIKNTKLTDEQKELLTNKVAL